MPTTTAQTIQTARSDNLQLFESVEARINQLNRNSLLDSFAMGEALIEIKEITPKGAYQAWVELYLPFSYRQAHKYVEVYEKFSYLKESLNEYPFLNFSILAVLVSAKQEIIEQVLEQLRDGEKLTKEEVNRLMKGNRPSQPYQETGDREDGTEFSEPSTNAANEERLELYHLREERERLRAENEKLKADKKQLEQEKEQLRIELERLRLEKSFAQQSTPAPLTQETEVQQPEKEREPDTDEQESEPTMESESALGEDGWQTSPFPGEYEVLETKQLAERIKAPTDSSALKLRKNDKRHWSKEYPKEAKGYRYAPVAMAEGERKRSWFVQKV